MREDWPAWATEAVTVAEHDPAWAERARSLQAELDTLLGPWLDGTIEHVGSTAVPGLAAKPVIDLVAPVRGLEAAAAADAALADAGWQLVPPELDNRPWRRFYVLPSGDVRAAHLHLVEPDHPRWTETLTFRDALRADDALRDAYGALKARLAEEHRDDREAYTAAKAVFVERALRRVPAPGLREVADIWFDTGRDPVVEWDAAGRRFDLVDPGEPDNRLGLHLVSDGETAPERIARALAEGLAACDFPPTSGTASPEHVRRALRAAGIDDEGSG